MITNMHTISKKLTVKNMMKYIIQGIVVAIIAYILPNRKVHTQEIMYIAGISTLTFFMLDIFTNNIISEAAVIGVGVGVAEKLLTLPILI